MSCHSFTYIFSLFPLLIYRKNTDCKRCVVIYEKHPNVLQYKESECEVEQNNKPSSAAISSVIRSDYNTDSRFQGNEQYIDVEGKAFKKYELPLCLLLWNMN